MVQCVAYDGYDRYAYGYSDRIEVKEGFPGTIVYFIEDYHGYIEGLCFTRDGSLVSISFEGTMNLYSKEGQRVWARHFPIWLRSLCSIAHTVHGSLLIVGCFEGTIFVVNQSNTIVRSFRWHQKSITSLVSFHPNSFITGSLDGNLRIWNISETPDPEIPLSHYSITSLFLFETNPISSLVISSCSRWLAIGYANGMLDMEALTPCQDQSNSFTRLDIPLWSIEIAMTPITEMAFSPNSQYIAINIRQYIVLSVQTGDTIYKTPTYVSPSIPILFSPHNLSIHLFTLNHHTTQSIYPTLSKQVQSLLHPLSIPSEIMFILFSRLCRIHHASKHP